MEKELAYKELAYKELPYKELPIRALVLISQYSKPMTNPQWKSLHKLLNYTLITDIYKLLNKGPVFRKVLHNCIDTEWFNKFKTVAQFGISIYNEPYNKNIEIAHKIYISKYVKWCDYNLFHNKSVI